MKIGRFLFVWVVMSAGTVMLISPVRAITGLPDEMISKLFVGILLVMFGALEVADTLIGAIREKKQ